MVGGGRFQGVSLSCGWASSAPGCVVWSTEGCDTLSRYVVSQHAACAQHAGMVARSLKVCLGAVYAARGGRPGGLHCIVNKAPCCTLSTFRCGVLHRVAYASMHVEESVPLLCNFELVHLTLLCLVRGSTLYHWTLRATAGLVVLEARWCQLLTSLLFMAMAWTN